jgi:transposase-like protein
MEYSELVRARMVRKMVGPNAVNASVLAKETGISQPTLSRWLRGAASLKLVTTTPDDNDDNAQAARRPQDWSPVERMQLVLEANGLGEHELGELLRRRGVHREQLDEWRASLDEAFTRPSGRRSSESKRIKQLEREVARKDKALAETAAILVLQKKLQLLFPEGSAAEDDDTDDGSDR